MPNLIGLGAGAGAGALAVALGLAFWPQLERAAAAGKAGGVAAGLRRQRAPPGQMRALPADGRGDGRDDRGAARTTMPLRRPNWRWRCRPIPPKSAVAASRSPRRAP